MYGIELSRAAHNTVGVSATRRIQARKLLPGHLHGITAISLKSLHSPSLPLALSLSLSLSFFSLPLSFSCRRHRSSVYSQQRWTRFTERNLNASITLARGDITLYFSRRWNWISWRRRNSSSTCKTSRYFQYSRQEFGETQTRIRRNAYSCLQIISLLRKVYKSY